MSSATDVVTALDVALRVATALDGIGCEYFVGGSLASSLQGEPRATNDIDLVVAMMPHRVRVRGEAPPAPASPLLGRSKDRAIEVCQPRGERGYLAQLRCPDGARPDFSRNGSVGSSNARKPGTPDSDMLDQMDPSRLLRPGETDYHIIDVYRVVCSDKEHEIYMDMYHCVGPQTSEVPSGFTTARDGDI